MAQCKLDHLTCSLWRLCLSCLQDQAVSAASALLSAAHHAALPLHELACAALAMLEARARPLRPSPHTNAATATMPLMKGWLLASTHLLGDIFTALSEAGSLAAVAEPATAMLSSTVMSLGALPISQQVRWQKWFGKSLAPCTEDA